jgi:regulator of sigma E protease
MDHIFHLVQTLASFALVLGVLVSFHEMGHYLAARACGIRVEAFSLGFGPALKTWVDRRGTEWRISMLPLGGYVKMYGMSPEARAESDADAEPFSASEAYCEKKVWQRSIVAAAGPVANFLLAMVLFAVLLGFTGRQVALPVVGEVLPHSAAAQAGLQQGDKVIAVNGKNVTLFEDLRQVVVASPGKDLALQVHRGSADLTLTAHIQAAPGGGSGLLGVKSGAFRAEHVGVGGAILGGVTETWDALRQTVLGLVSIISGQTGADELGGPIAIAHMSGQVAQLGLTSLIGFIALLSVNLGLVNLLPIPVLDGGHLMFYAAEAVRGRPVPPRAQEYGYRLGMAIIACIFVFASFNDLAREGAFRWVAHLIG